MILIRIVDTLLIRKTVRDLCVKANCHLGCDILSRLRESADRERSPIGKEILDQIVENAGIADCEGIPVCQDTGFAVVFIDIGQNVCLTGEYLMAAVNSGVKDGYTEGCLRKSMVADPLKRINTGNNTPAIVHIRIVPGDRVSITVAPKGGGSENMSSLKMLKPAEGEEGVKKFVVETVKNAGPNPCPPVIVGVGIGGTMEKAALLAKQALTREAGAPSNDADTARLEWELLAEINQLGIGPQGLGGDTTALAVHIEKYATHIACLPVAVNLGCHAYRHTTAII